MTKRKSKAGAGGAVKQLAAEVKALRIASKVSKGIKRASRASRAGKSGGFLGSIGKTLGGAAGGFLGGMATKALMSITGSGDYKVHSNSLYVHALNSSPPPVFRADSHSTRVVHREFIGDVLGAQGFQQRYKFPINPNTSVTFPWLSNIAIQFEEYRFHGLVFEFKSTSGSAISSTNAALGTVLMATQYNYYAPDFRTKIAMDSYEYCVTTKPDCSALHPVECDPKLNGRSVFYVDTSQFSSGGDARMSYMGNFYLYVVGQQANDTNLGELWVTYDVELLKPRLQSNSASAAEANSAMYVQNSSDRGGNFLATPTDYFAFTKLFPDTSTTSLRGLSPSTSNFPVDFGTAANGYPNTLFFPPGFRGKLVFLWTMYTSVGTSGGASPAVNANATVLSVTTGNGVFTAVGGICDPNSCAPNPSGNTYEVTGAPTSASYATLANLTLRYTFWFDGTASLDPITNRSTATVKFSSTLSGLFNSVGTAINWAHRFEFYPVFL